MNPIVRARRLALVGAVALAAACGTTVPQGLQSAGGQAGGLSSGPQSGATSGPASGQQPILPGSSNGAVVGSSGGGTTEPGSSSGTQAPGTAVKPAPIAAGASGFGYDAKHFYIGMPTARDSAAAFKAAGANFDNGDVEADVAAIVGDINRSGGVLGRQLVPVFHDLSTAKVLANPAAAGQEVCTYFTQDRPVIAVVIGFPQLEELENMHRCLEAKKVTSIAVSNTLYSSQDFSRLGPHLWSLLTPPTELLVPTFLESLNHQQFFTGWDTTSGKPGAAPVKVGVLLPDSRVGHAVFALMQNSLATLGRKADGSFFYGSTGSGNGSQAAVLQFKAAGITHILDLPPVEGDIGSFQSNSEQQRYRPRHAFTSFNLPSSIETNAALAPPAQQVGSLGIGFQPGNDTDDAHKPSPTPGYARCIAALARGGQTFHGKRHAETVGLSLCDAFYLLRDAAKAGGGFSGAALLAGMPVARTPVAGTFANGLSPTSKGLPGVYREERYDSTCSCFVYTGGNRPFHR
ncbi:MAG: hypothetical protein JWM40_1833 [Frankiales bacterium]|nr:hypothetical protein [Frankiales bacterium]